MIVRRQEILFKNCINRLYCSFPAIVDFYLFYDGAVDM